MPSVVFTSSSDSRSAEAFSWSMSTCSCGVPATLLARTDCRRGSLLASRTSFSRACNSRSAPMPEVSCNQNSKPFDSPSPSMGGGTMPKTSASRCCLASALPARSTMACALLSALARSDQSFSETNAMPMFCPEPL
ncbi:hypothetical protein D3C72_1193360 [compost metagenome]